MSHICASKAKIEGPIHPLIAERAGQLMAQHLGRSIGNFIYTYQWGKLTKWEITDQKGSTQKVRMLFSVDTSRGKSFRGLAVGVNEVTGELVYFGDDYGEVAQFEAIKREFEMAYAMASAEAVMALRGYKLIQLQAGVNQKTKKRELAAQWGAI